MWYKLAQQSPENINLQLSSGLMSILTSLRQNNMMPLIVGGAVRDAVLGNNNPKDIDIEVYNTSLDDLEKALKTLSQKDPGSSVDVVGKSFGVIKYRDSLGEDYDFSVPRRDSKIGVGHTGFKTEFGGDISPKEAASRRDYTMNSLAFDPFEKKVIDFFGGVKDLQNKVLRHTSSAFSEDPLRVLRGLQFAARMGLTLAPETAAIAKSISHQHNDISKERIEGEWRKLVEKGKNPGSAIQYLIDTGWIEHYPEIKDMIGINQDPEWHPEGEVGTHTTHVMNAAAAIADRQGLKGDERAVLIYSALAHDFAKAHTTELREKDGKMRWTAHGHEAAGGPLARQFLERLGVKKTIIDKVVPLVENHLAHITFDPQKTPSHMVRKLADKLYPATIQELVYLIEADHSGRPPLPQELPEQAKRLHELATEQNLHQGRPEPLIKGKDVMRFGISPGPFIGEIVKQGYQAQLNGQINNELDAENWLRKTLRPKVSLINGNNPLFQKYNISGPALGKALNDAYDAQLNGMFNSGSEAQIWLDKYLKQHI